MDYHGEGITQPESPPLNDGLLVDAADQISYLSADSVPYMNDQIMCNTMKSASTSPASPLKQDEEHHVHIESDMQNDAAERKVHHNDDCEVRTTSSGYDVHQNTEVVEGVLPPELHESSGNDISNFQQETTHSDAYLGDSMLADNSSRDYQFSNSGDDDDDEIPNSSAPQMGNKDNRKLHETFHNEVNGTEDDQMNGGNSNPHDEHDNENFNSAIAPSYLDGMEQEDPGTENGISTPGNQWDSPPERSAGLEKGTPSPARRVSLSVERSPHAHSSEKLDSPHHAKEGDNLADSRSPPARHRSRSPGSPENHDTNRRRAPSHELSPHARDNSPERKAQSRRGDGSPRRRSTSPGRRDGSPQRRSASPKRRDGSPRRRSASPRRRHGSPRRRSGGGNPQQERGTPQQGREIDQNQGHHQGKLIPLDIKGSMVDLDQGLHTLGITIEDLQEEGIHQGTDHLQQGIILLKDVGHHLPTGRLDWVSLGGICLLQVLAMPPQSESWRRNLQSLDV
ncbi:unnamed protein product [Triticum turgidum subsp. durum]|uniref:Uncharacterized protein n=1 Tax=Triticum turgidum subsp. durum TaxID=4567 RepID=A0A9R1PL82_TRITD|nr:unnamed protein product [Triticum turgidum subsp. durum]